MTFAFPLGCRIQTNRFHLRQDTCSGRGSMKKSCLDEDVLGEGAGRKPNVSEAKLNQAVKSREQT